MGKTEQNILSERGRGMHFPLSVSCASPACYADQRHGDDYIGSHRKAQPLAGVQWNSWTLIHIIKTMIIAELWRAKRACGAHVTEHRPQPARPSALQENQCSISHFLASLVAQEDWYCTHIVHQCCDQLTAVKTGYLLTSITWPYRGLRCRPIEVEYLFEVIRWQVTSFQMIAGSSLIFF